MNINSEHLTLQVTSKLKSLPQTVPLMLQEVLGRLESDLGQEVVALAMSLLVCSRDGKILVSTFLICYISAYI